MDSQYSHLAWSMQPRQQGGLGPGLELPLVAGGNMQISCDYGVLIEDEGIALRCHMGRYCRRVETFLILHHRAS